MVLVVDGVVQDEAPPDARTFFLTHPSFKHSSDQFLSNPVKVVCSSGLLYVLQREMAVTVPYDRNVTIMGSDDATTCIIIILRHTGSGAVGLAHLDGSSTEECISTMIQKIQEASVSFPSDGRLELFLVGGLSDSRHYSDEVFYSIMHTFHKQAAEIDVVLACIGENNTAVRNGINWPIVYGVGVNVRTREIFPATFPDKGPERPLRMARQLTGGHEVIDIYDYQTGLLKIGPFNYEPLRGVDLWLEQADEFILQHLSTTPDVEPPHFVMEIRSALKYIHDNPFPAITVFRGNKPHCYRRDEHSLWVPYHYENNNRYQNSYPSTSEIYQQ